METGRMMVDDTNDYSADRLIREGLAYEDELEKRRAEAAQVPWVKLSSLGPIIRARATDPWITLSLGDDHLVRARVGATIVIMGGSGSGKTSLKTCLLLDHARNVGPAIDLSLELPADEAGARVVSIRLDVSWEDALCARVLSSEMDRVLNEPRYFVLDRRRATIKNLEKCIDAARAEFPGEPILVAIDYAQLLDSDKREERLRVADAFSQIDECAREKRFVALALSQMSRANQKRARDGEAIGAESSDLGAESAAIERFATVTMAIGKSTLRDDGSEAVELSVGKARMSKGDKVFPMSYWGKSGLWRVAGDAQRADEVREKRSTAKVEKREQALENQIVGALTKSEIPQSRNQLIELTGGRRNDVLKAITKLLGVGNVVEIARKAPHSKAWLVWTLDRARQAGAPLVRDALEGGLFE